MVASLWPNPVPVFQLLLAASPCFRMGPGPQPLSPPAPGLFAESSYKEADRAPSGGELQGAGKQQHCLAQHNLLCTMGKDKLPSKPNIFLLLLFFLPGNTSLNTEP
ncbi:hypothetical protein EK904_007037 [Melospiza melodia maxima]|nr:hypothetical protein EK904_007037 [Melospiza melodia maxima]